MSLRKRSKRTPDITVETTQTDRQTNSLTPYTRMCGFFLQVIFATSILASLTGG